MVMGEGRSPKISHLVKLGVDAKLSKKLIEEIIGQTKSSLDRWTDLARNHHVTKANIELVAKTISGSNRC